MSRSTTMRDMAPPSTELKGLQNQCERWSSQGDELIKFNDELVKQGVDGGMRASWHLKCAMEENITQLLPEPVAPNLRFHARVYANISGLAETYVKLGILSNAKAFSDFVRGFNMGHNMCDYIDAGNGKECADEKVKANFEFNMTDIHCRGVVFGGTADNGYARMLGPYVQDENNSRRIILVEGPGVASEIANVMHRFQTVLLDNIFRDRKLSSPASSRPDTPPNLRVHVQDGEKGYATMAAKATKSPPDTDVTQVGGENGFWIHKPKWDHLGRRQDQQLPQHLLPEMRKIRDKKYCNSYHLLGNCPYPFCFHKHGARLTKSSAQCLAAISRRNACPQGAYCKDLDCIQGHRCPFERCENGLQCKFPKEMHY
ncbi:CCCH zinc finger DNA binding protein [Geosmithia morbida]|uniref:CCCH zinc finger DNA binding protein n=1 Tax=Geosmithia morbida TaxID=1094350 RepID=A0A9P5D386_9HYPO|nr:CCCH zinc finger DNA binding protein [Geosmithia morbida]KAF4125928.1 CCCH zinc finger DNA binding protein [Geosmithia morbida]